MTAETKRAQRPDGRKARTRAAIKDAAGRLFAEFGFERTTIEQIAEAADVSVGSVYVHFGSKERLHLVITTDAMDVNDRYIEEAQQADSPLERVLGVGDAYLRFALEHTVAFRFVSMRPVEPAGDRAANEAERLVTERLQRIIMSIAADLQLAMDVGELRPVPLADAMTFVWGAWSGVAGLMLRQDSLAIDAEQARRALELAKQVLTAGLHPDTPPHPAAPPSPPAA
jgi:TetR/AcrR family transcriptional regulator